MSSPNPIKGRYEVRKVLGQGGMGVVYDAYDRVVKRGVALKTIRDIPGRAALDLFYKECDVLASISHPNIVEIFDIGEFEEDGSSKPYFVMPLLPGKTLDDLIRAGSNRLTVERSVEILTQTCRGLQAAHERGLVHRDLKPSNIFVMDDDSVKIIDFGIAHMADAHSTVGHKGTLLYMAPEQVEMKPASALSDIFALGVVAFETLTLRHPFERTSAADVASAILKQIPPSVSDLNPSINTMVGRVVHKAMAKQPWYRFQTCREMAEALQKASRNEPLDMFDPARIQPRIERAAKAFEQGDHQFADEILTELEAEGHVDATITSLRRQIDQAQRQKLISQLLESARTRAEQQEYPLALQKLQELLAIDPANGAALALKTSIENRRSEQKIDDWFRIARQHMEQNAFSHARQALQNVLELKPRDSRAQQMVAEVDRREQEFVRARQEKEQLYTKAVEAWQNGEVSAALSKLVKLVEIDALQPDTVAPERSATFQSFYNQVRSEHDVMKSAYEQARRHLVEGHFDAALEICKEQLARRPGQALFQALKFDVEEARRQELSARIAEVDRAVEAEPDLEKRVNILAGALEQYPGETHFERALRTMREKRDLIHSITGKAHAYEERGQFADALAQWEILRTIYSQYPGIDFEMDRVRRRRDQQLRSDAKVKWVEQIDWHLAAGNFNKAAELLAAAYGEFPGDAELAELEKLANQGLARAADAQKLLAEAQALCSQNRFEEGIEVLRKAHYLDERNASIRTALTGTLVEHARARLDQDWRAAEVLAQQAIELDPANGQARSLRELALDRKREEYVNGCLAQARRLQTEGQLDAALQQVEQGLTEFPRETRLAQLRSTLARARTESRTYSPPSKGPDAPTQAAETVALPPVAAAASVPGPPPAPAERLSAPPPPVPVSATGLFSAAETIAIPPPAPVAPPPASPKTVAPPRPSPPPQAKRKKPSGPMIAIAAGVAVVLGAAVVVVPKLKRAPAPAPVEATAPALTPPPAAELPSNPTLRIFADLENGKYALDDQPPADLQDGQLSLDNLAPGKHTIKIASSREQATLVFEAAAGSAPVIESITAKEALAVTVAGIGGRARVQSSSGSAKVAIDGKPVGETGVVGLDLNDLAAGNHEIAIGEGKDRKSMVLAVGPAPMLTAFLKSDRNVGTLVLVTGEDGVKVFLNGKEYRRQTQRGQLRIPNLDVKPYTVKVVKDGFVETAEQTAEIRKGEESKLEFHLQPVPRVASLSIQGAVPGAQVLLDEAPIGTVQDDGTFSASSVPPGSHSVELRKEAYKPRRIDKRFEAGSSVQLAAAEVGMDKLQGGLRISVTPADARVTIAHGGEAPRPVTAGTTLALPDGSYTVTARAANYADRSATVTVAAGKTESVELALTKNEVKTAGMADWDDAAAWQHENQWYVRKGGNFVGFKPASINGTFVFTAELRKGKRLQWVAGRNDPQNYLLFQIDKKFFYRLQVVNGKETQIARQPFASGKGDTYTIQIDVAGGSIVHRIFDGSKWVVLDTWEEAGRAFGNGKFGFLIPGGDTVALSNFKFTPTHP